MSSSGGVVKIIDENAELKIPKKFSRIELKKFKLEFLNMCKENPPKVNLIS